MKLFPVCELIRGQRLLFCEDSIVRGTQLKDTVQRLFSAGAREIHMRPGMSAADPRLQVSEFLAEPQRHEGGH